jgi:hypothetical protein
LSKMQNESNGENERKWVFLCDTVAARVSSAENEEYILCLSVLKLG